MLVHSYNRRHEMEHARLLFEAVQKSTLSPMTFGETTAILHSILKTGQPFRLQFTADFDRIEEWVASWKRLGGTAVRSQEHA